MSDLLQRLLDERDVVARLYTYCAAADAPTATGFLDCFTADAEFVYRAGPDAAPAIHLRGREALERWFEERLPAFPPGTMNHTTIHPQADIDGDEATSTSRFVSIRANPRGLVIASTGGYRDRLVRCEDGGWRFAQRVCTGDLPRGA